MSQQQVMISHLVQDNSTLLTQLKHLLASLSDANYRSPFEQLQSGGIGAHARHIFDHYDALFRHTPTVNYDARERDERLELERDIALEKIEHLIIELGALKEDRNLEVISTTNTLRQPAPCLSSIARELNFLHSHTTHHMAIIRLLCLHLSLDIDSNFGKAMSTQKFEQDVQS